MARKVIVKGIRKGQLDTDDIERLNLVYWLQSKRILRERREREARKKAKRRERKR